MNKKKPKKSRGATAKKTTLRAKPKKAPAKKKRVANGKTKTEKVKTTKKTVKKEIKKVKVKPQKKEAAGKAKDKETKKVTIKKKGKAEKKVEVKKVNTKPRKKIPPKELVSPEKTAWLRPEKVLLPEKEERHPPLPVDILSEEYGEDSIALMIVDPSKLFIYWEVIEDTFKKHKGTLNIRLYDITGVDFDGIVKSYVDIVIQDMIGNLYLDVNPEKEFIADIGIIDSSSAFVIVARSNRASTPPAEVIEKGILPHRLYETGIEKNIPIPPIGYEK
jgi:hypothetical protein